MFVSGDPLASAVTLALALLVLAVGGQVYRTWLARQHRRRS
jgi:hypothetical protein